MRYQPPLQTKDQNGQFAELARVLDAREPPAAYAVARGTTVQVGAGETRRLAPRAAGMTAIIPAADETNYGALITLLVDSALGTTRIAPVSGTINGAASFTIAAGYKSLIVLMSDGDGRWLTERAEGYPLTNGDKGDITVSGNGDNWQIDANAVSNAELAQMAAATLKGRALGAGTGNATDLTAAQVADIVEPEAFDWSGAHQFTGRVRWNGPFSQTLTGNTDNLAIGAVNVVRLVGAGFNLTGMVADVTQQLVWLQNADAAANLVLVHNATSTAANRFFCPNNANYTMTPRCAVWARYDSGDSRWYIAPGAA